MLAEFQFNKLRLFALALFSSGLCAQPPVHSVTCSWTDFINPNGTTYNVYRAPGNCSGSPAFSQIASGIAILSYVDTPVPAGDYCYQVTASLNGLESTPSSSVLAQVFVVVPVSGGNSISSGNSIQ